MGDSDTADALFVKIVRMTADKAVQVFRISFKNERTRFIRKGIRVFYRFLKACAVDYFLCASYRHASDGCRKCFSVDNGRFETILEALRLLPSYVFSGIGGSAADYTLSSMGVSVHNFFVAYLIQFGVFGGLVVNTLLLSPVFEPKNKHWYLLVCVVLGGMLFANWHNVLYVVPLYLFFLLENRSGCNQKFIL